ncbi:chloride channel protein [bacterium]|nr:chloride channel protein [bacterium]
MITLLKLFKKIRLDEQTQMIVYGTIVGIVAGFGAVAFRMSISVVSKIGFGESHSFLERVSEIPIYWKILIPAIGGLVVGPIIYFMAREAKGHGVPAIMEAVAVHNGRMRIRSGIAKFIASAVTIGTGGSTGREGPIAQIGAVFGSTIAKIFKLKTIRTRNLVACGAGAGIAATFDAPIAGALFALEVVLGDFRIKNFAPIMIASVVATVIAKHFLVDVSEMPVLHNPAFHYSMVSAWEIPMYMLLGVFAGVISIIYIKTLTLFEDTFDRWKFPEMLKPAIGGLLLGLICVKFPQLFGNANYSAINTIIEGNIFAWIIFGLIFLKIIATSLTLGSGGSGGIFAPALFIGAATGAAFGNFINIFFPNVTATPASYALVGMGALVAGVTHAPLTAILIIFEITDKYPIILPLMISCTISCILVAQVMKDSIYTIKLTRKGIKVGQEQKFLLQTLFVRDVVQTKFRTISASMPYKEFLKMLPYAKQPVFPVLDKDRTMMGLLSFQNYQEVVFEEGLDKVLVVGELASKDIVKVFPNDDLETALWKIGTRDIESVPVVDPYQPDIVIGMISRRDIISGFNKALLKAKLEAGVDIDDKPAWVREENVWE